MQPAVTYKEFHRWRPDMGLSGSPVVQQRVERLGKEFRGGQGLQDIGVTLREPVSQVILVLTGFAVFLTFPLLPLSLQSHLYKSYMHVWYDMRVMDLCLVQRFIPLFSGSFVDPTALKYVSLSPFILAITRGRKSKLKVSLKVSLEAVVHTMSSSTNLLPKVKGLAKAGIWRALD